MLYLSSDDQTSHGLSDFVLVPAGRYIIGSDHDYPEEKPEISVEVPEFLIAKYATSNREFSEFVAETGYITTAEKPLCHEEFSGIDPELLVPGSMVFVQPTKPVPLHDASKWWKFVAGACWKHPEGPESDLEGREDHPVVQISHADALAYCVWKGLMLPSEIEWEVAARGGVTSRFPWGDELVSQGHYRANTWQGEFPWHNSEADGFVGTAPVHAYGSSGYGTYNMLGNVWEWTNDVYKSRHDVKNCCAVKREGTEAGLKLRTIKGGSYLCSPDYCKRYRAAARTCQDVRAASNHLGFRCKGVL